MGQSIYCYSVPYFMRHHLYTFLGKCLRCVPTAHKVILSISNSGNVTMATSCTKKLVDPNTIYYS